MGTWCIASLSSSKVCHVVGCNCVFLEGCHEGSTLCVDNNVSAEEKNVGVNEYKIYGAMALKKTYDLNTFKND